MSKLIVGQIVSRAKLDINLAKAEANLPENFRKIQDAFRNSALLQNHEELAELCGLITGFRPRASSAKINPFQIFVVMSKAETRPIKCAIVMWSGSGNAFGCTSLNEGSVAYQADTCRLATEEEAMEFINNEITGWEDASVLNWIKAKMGDAYFSPFFAELDRMPTATVAAGKSR